MHRHHHSPGSRRSLLLAQRAARMCAALGRLGYRVLRLDAELVLRELPVALARIRTALENGRG